GVSIARNGPFLRRNLIGTDASGNGEIGNGGDGVLMIAPVGATELVQGNTVSGNRGDGLHVEAATTSSFQLTMDANFIGTNSTGTGRLGNHGHGIHLTGPAHGRNGRHNA